ncbi:methyltransferase domain-containing protein [bacterium]|nr:methyltransferase domain-containing protein [bacterium]
MLADARAIPFCKESFSTILCFGGLHVIAHPEEALASIARVLTPNGVLHASVLLKPRGKVSRKLAERYVDLGFLSTIFKFNDIINLVREAGFKVTQTIRNGDMLLLSARLNRSTNFGQGESSL